MASRGIEHEPYRLGYVEDPLPGHEKYQGYMAIPYYRKSARGDYSVVSIRFRCIRDHDHSICQGKYKTVFGDTPRLYNTFALQEETHRIGITEGELDAIVASQSGTPSVGVPGSNNWKGYFREPFLGFQQVYVFGDGDEAGGKFVSTVLKAIPHARAVMMPDGHDVNSFIQERGVEAFKARL